MVSVRRGFLFLLVLGMSYVILLWHSPSLPYNYFIRKENNFYELPKIDKSKDISNIYKTSESKYIEVSLNEEISLRPIMAGPAKGTHRLSNLINTF